MKRPRQSAVRQNAGPLALFSFVVNVTASFFRQFSRHISTWEKELNRRRQTLKPLENQGFFRLSLLYRNGTRSPANPSLAAFPPRRFRKRWAITPSRFHWMYTRTSLTQCMTKQRPECNKESWNERGKYRNDFRFQQEHSETELWSKLWSNGHLTKSRILTKQKPLKTQCFQGFLVGAGNRT